VLLALGVSCKGLDEEESLELRDLDLAWLAAGEFPLAGDMEVVLGRQEVGREALQQLAVLEVRHDGSPNHS
jgi:hypothetical protein